jgi:small-conductance mechanosensitive channel
MALLLIVTVIVVIWIEQLRTIAAAAVVIAAAIVIATKEFLLNIVGYFYRSTAKFFTIGDRIEIDGIRGDVIDQNLMGITLLEIGPGAKTHQYTGLTAHIPNSLFFANTVKNETNLWSDYVFHLMTIPIQADDNWKTKENALLDAAREICSPYMEDARRAMSTQAFQHSLEEPSIDPRVQVQVTGADQYLLILRIPVPVGKRGRMEQEITRRYLELTLTG